MRRDGPPDRSYLICAAQRSGTTLLCELLRGTGRLGAPAEYFEQLRATGSPRQPREYFLDSGVPETELAHLPQVEARSPRGHREFTVQLDDALERGTTANGVFGAKMMWNYFDDFLADLAALPERRRNVPDAADHEFGAAAIEAVLPGVRYVLVEREDKVAQAVSLWKAVQTRQWRDDGRRRLPEPVYSYEAIDHLVSECESWSGAWRRWFAANRIEPLELTYERFVHQRAEAVDAIARHVGVAGVEPVAFATPLMRRQADARSMEWIERYLEQRELVAAGG